MIRHETEKKIRGVIVAVCGVLGYGLIWKHAGWELAVAIFLTFTSHYAEKH